MTSRWLILPILLCLAGCQFGRTTEFVVNTAWPEVKISGMRVYAVAKIEAIRLAGLLVPQAIPVLAADIADSTGVPEAQRDGFINAVTEAVGQ